MEILRHCQRCLIGWRTLRGRATRGEFWVFHAMLVVVLFLVVLGYFFTLSAMGADVDSPMRKPITITYIVLSAGLMIFLFIASVSVTVRRLHDRNRSGKWYLFYAVLSVVQAVYSQFVPTNDTAIMIGAGLAGLVLLSTLIGFILMCLKGTDGVNNYGADPQRPIDLNVFA